MGNFFFCEFLRFISGATTLIDIFTDIHIPIFIPYK